MSDPWSSVWDVGSGYEMTVLARTPDGVIGLDGSGESPVPVPGHCRRKVTPCSLQTRCLSR